jgi:hypothetical protein
MNVVLVSGFFDLDAMNFVECPRCRLPAGKICIDHRERNLQRSIPRGLQTIVHRSRIAPAYIRMGRSRLKRYASTTGSWPNEKPPAIVPGVFAVHSPSTSKAVGFGIWLSRSTEYSRRHRWPDRCREACSRRVERDQQTFTSCALCHLRFCQHRADGPGRDAMKRQ